MKNSVRKDLNWGERGAFAVVGVSTIVYGYGKMLRGQWIYENWRGLDTSAWLEIALGLFFLLVAVFPWGRVQFLWNTDRRRSRR